MIGSRPAAPNHASLPCAQPRSTRGGTRNVPFEVRAKLVTPILGGGTQPRELDEVDIIRAPTVRGHLRFWWRALYGHQFLTSKELYEAEGAVWGRAGSDRGGRSKVEVRVDVEFRSGTERENIRLSDSKDGKATAGAYALWPAREEREKGQVKKPAAPRYKPGTQFRLRIMVPEDREVEIRNAVRAWLLFGAYGSRTRRGLGSLTADENPADWLPVADAREAFAKLFGRDILASPGRRATDVPWLAGASLQVGHPVREAFDAWTAALNWLKEFRQGTSGHVGDRAREPSTGKSWRPSISNWPEADKVRHLVDKTKGHPPRHNATPVWPRAGFGLPIIGQFQKNSRDGGRYDEPDAFELCWRSSKPDRPGEFEKHDRLASPLIVKALPLANGTFVPCALWLNRAYPGGEVFVRGVDDSAAPFNRLVALGDKPRFSALTGKSSLREAFLDWLRAKYGTTVVAQ
jgi:CRISPR-associated protein Cmr1